MKKLNIIVAGAAIMAMAAGCSEEQFNITGEGDVRITTRLSSDMKVVSRADDGVADESWMLWISNDKGLVRKYDGLADFPVGTVPLLAGSYTAEVWAGDSVSASFDKRWFKGVEHFTVTDGATTAVTLTAKIANVAVSVNYADNIEDVLDDFVLTVSHDRGSLEYVGREQADTRGYFMMPSTDTDLRYVLTGKQKNGDDFSFEGLIPDAQPATEYRLKVSYTAQESNKGGMIITIMVDEHAIEIEDEVTVIAAPIIAGYDFDLSQSIRGKKGSFGDYSVNVLTAGKIESIELRSPLFDPIIGGSDFMVPGISAQLAAELNAAGIFCEQKALLEGESGDRYQLMFASEFMNSLNDGNYAIAIIATDTDGKRSSATLSLTISDDPLTVEAATLVRCYSATLHAAVNKAGEGYGFIYRAAGDDEWIAVEGTPAGTGIEARLTGLAEGTDYEFRAKAGEYESKSLTFSTYTALQIPNSSFEEWGTDASNSKVVIPAANNGSQFWDSGNHGSATMNKNVTNKSADYAHTGTYSALLSSQFVGIGGMGKLAAGNIFAGKYLGTSGTNGFLGWGRDFASVPSAVRAWVKYHPVAITHAEANPANASKGDMDCGIIYVALIDDTPDRNSKLDASYTSYYSTYPVIISTKDKVFFNSQAQNVIAYGEVVFDSDFGTDGLEEVKFDLVYREGRENDRPAKIIIVASASRYGDYFTGGSGSNMYLDDFELIYE